MWRRLGLLILLSLTTACASVGTPEPTKASNEASSEEPNTEGMVRVPAGEFIMGSNEGEGDEKPERKVFLDGFWIDAHEVTVEKYEKCVNAKECKAPETGEHYNWGVAGKEKHPVNGVNWNDAVSYCKWAGKRLPSEAEWEKAARGTDGRRYPWGNESASCDFAVMQGQEDQGGCGKGGTWEVGSKPKGVSPYGAHDMSGNVFEWVNDMYSSDYYERGDDRNPQGPKEGSNPVGRGGSWHESRQWSNAGDGLRAANRNLSPSETRYFNLGFRCAM